MGHYYVAGRNGYWKEFGVFLSQRMSGRLCELVKFGSSLQVFVGKQWTQPCWDVQTTISSNLRINATVTFLNVIIFGGGRSTTHMDVVRASHYSVLPTGTWCDYIMALNDHRKWFTTLGNHPYKRKFQINFNPWEQTDFVITNNILDAHDCGR